MRKLIVAVVLEGYAFLLAWMQSLGGVRTDEAKYLLNIPYPHPPLARWFFSRTADMPGQEWLWRFVLASLLVQAVWLVWRMANRQSLEQRFTAAILWLTAAAFILQAGSIMMAPLTALQGLVLLWLLFERERRGGAWSAWSACGIGVFWFVSLFTAYQAVLYTPVAFAIFRRSRFSLAGQVFFLLAPIAVAGLYALSEPLVLASFLLAGTKDAGTGFVQKLMQLFQGWSLGGSILLGLTGVAGMLLDRRWTLFLATGLIAAFLLVSFQPYYAILFLPLFLAGTILLFKKIWHHPAPLIFPHLVLTAICIMLFPPVLLRSPARDTMRAIVATGKEGTVLIAGSYGHEWQYESPFPVRRFVPSLLSDAEAVVCLEKCEGMDEKTWTKLPGMPVETWVRKAVGGRG
ncbi:MAG: hypothetical protein PHW10_03255 [Candidatus Peribacteraceae bacterium]|nr:hypothetical protein [Candidatus Peribacteraceae bacterium]